MNDTARNVAQVIINSARENGFLAGTLTVIPELADAEKKLFVRMLAHVHSRRASSTSTRQELSIDEISSLFTFVLAKAAELVTWYAGGKLEEPVLDGMLDGKIPLYADDRLTAFCKQCRWPEVAAAALISFAAPKDSDPLLVLMEGLKWSFRISVHLVSIQLERHGMLRTT